MNFAKLSDTNRWRDVTYLTFDQDWCAPEILFDTLNLIGDRACTVFTTDHISSFGPAESTQQLLSMPNVEVGFHPGDNCPKNIEDGVKWFKEHVPSLRCVRVHTLQTSSRILQSLAGNGVEVDSSVYIPLSSGCDLHPWKRYGMTIMPICWEDDLELVPRRLGDIRNLRFYPGVKVVNFHPFHIYINTMSEQHYRQAKPFYDNPEKALEFRGGGYGVRDALRDLLAQ